MAVLAAIFFPAHAVAAPNIDVSDYSIAAIDYVPGLMDKIGTLKAGLICLPKGTLRWRDVARAPDAAIIDLLSRALHSKGLSVASPLDPLFSDTAPLTRFRIRVVVEKARLRQCVAGSSLVKQRPSGNGTVTVRWETYDRQTRALIDTQRFYLPLAIDGRDARNSTLVLSDALTDSAVRYAAMRLN